MKEKKKRDKEHSFWLKGNRDEEHFHWLKDHRDFADVRFIIVIALMLMLVILIPALVIGGNHKKGAGAEAAKDTLAEEVVEESVGYVPGTAGNITIDSRQKDMDTKEEEPDMPDLSERYIYFAGYEDCSVGAGERMVLVNLPENEDIYIAYTVYLSDTGEEVFKTDLIAPGNSVEWTVSENLEPGEYRISLYQAPYILDNHGDFMELISASNEMTIIVNY